MVNDCFHGNLTVRFYRLLPHCFIFLGKNCIGYDFDSFLCINISFSFSALGSLPKIYFIFIFYKWFYGSGIVSLRHMWRGPCSSFSDPITSGHQLSVHTEKVGVGVKELNACEIVLQNCFWKSDNFPYYPFTVGGGELSDPNMPFFGKKKLF